MIKVWILAKKYMILLEDYSKKNKNYILNDTYTSFNQVALELTKNTDNTTYSHKIYVQDGHSAVTAFVKNSKITDTYTYNSYGILLKKTELCINTKDIFQRILMDLNRKWRYKWIKQD